MAATAGGPVLLHAHLFKNAGSTLDWSLRRQFGEGFVDHRDDNRMREGARYLGPWIEARPWLRALSSHWITFPLPSPMLSRLHLAIMLRDPLERAASVYRFERRQPDDDGAPGVRQAKLLEFPDYVRWRLRPEVGPVIRNYHTRYCSGDYFGEASEGMFQAAVATLDSTPLVGLVECYAETMALFEYHLQAAFPGVDLAWRVQNTSGDALPGAAGLRQRIALELGPVADEFEAANAWDLQLDAMVRERFQRAIDAVPDFRGRLAALLRRCEALR